MTDTIAAFTAILGKAHVLTGADAARYRLSADDIARAARS